jgi:hypothetical protein
MERMDAISYTLGAISIISGFLLMMGIVRPSFAVWWTTDKTRIKVIFIWGGICTLSSLAYILYMAAFKEDAVKDESRTQSYIEYKLPAKQHV